MKILLSSYQCVPGQGSELGNGWNWALALAEQGHEVTVATWPGHLANAGMSLDLPAPPGVEVAYVDIPEITLLPYIEGPGTIRNQFRWVVHYLRWQEALPRSLGLADRGFDVAHHVSWGSLHLGSRLWRLPVPLVFGPIGGGQKAPGAYWQYFGRNWPVESARSAATRASLLQLNGRSREVVSNSRVILVTNSATETVCRRLGGGDVRYMLAEGLPPDWISRSRKRSTDPPVVLWVGRLLPRKAPSLALRAFAELRSRMSARLVIAGDGPLLSQVRAMTQSLGLTRDVELLGRVPWQDMRSLYDSADAFLFTSLRDSSGSQFLEALGRGLPAVALNHHGVGDTNAGSAALKVELPPHPSDLPSRLAAALESVLCDGQWETRSQAGVDWAAGHTWPEKAAAATELYSEILSN